MGTLTAPEIRETHLSPQERAEARDSYVRSFERQFADWVDIAKVCIEVERDRDWELLGFASWNAWLLDAAPRSRSYIYLVTNRYKELSPDIPDEKLSAIPIGNTSILRKVSKKRRQEPKIIEAATHKPREFLKDLQELAPEQHLETIVEKTFKFSASQWEVIEVVYEKWNERDGPASFEDFIEWMASEVSDWTLHAESNERRSDNKNGAALHTVS